MANKHKCHNECDLNNPQDILKLDYHWIESRVFKLNHPNLYKEINDSYSNELKWMEKVYLYTHDMDNPPVCKRDGCNNRCNFLSLTRGYNKYCSHTCGTLDSRDKATNTIQKRYNVSWAMQCPEIKEKSIQTCLKKFGVENPMQCPEIKEKLKQTNIKKYGVENPMQCPEIKEKLKQTNIKKYGCECTLGNSKVQEKIRQTCLEKFGVEYSSQSEEIKKKSRETNLKKYGVEYYVYTEKFKKQLKEKIELNFKLKHPEVVERNGNIWICNCIDPLCDKCTEKTYTTNQHLDYFRTKNGICKCTVKLPLYSIDENVKSIPENIIQQFLDFYGIKYEHNVFGVIYNKRQRAVELDFILMFNNIAIEINGSFMHRLDCELNKTINKFKPKQIDYHIDKFIKTHEKGLELISIWDDWIFNDKQLVFDFILDKINNRPLYRYKEKWFPDLNDNEWPLDLGFPSSFSINNFEKDFITEHLCYHDKFLCSDCGIINLKTKKF